jgi:hypothetical protein
MNLNAPRLDVGTPLTADEADAQIKAMRRPLPFEGSLPQIDYSQHTSECADDYGDEPGVGAGVILWPIAVLLVAAICGVLVVLARSA